MALDPSELARLKVLEGVEAFHLLEACVVRTLHPGEVLLTMGEPNEVMYMILAGRLSIHLEGGPKSDPVAHLDAGEIVGELSVLDARPASAHVVAAEESRVLAVDGKTFWALADASHDFAINLLVLLAGRLRANNATVSDNIRLQREYKRNAMVDALTGLYNRRWLEEALPRFVNRYARSGEPLTVMMIDVDHFKRFNDANGHPAGDAALVAVAHTLRSSLRPTDHVARYGGEEFSAILPDTAGRAALGVAERVRAAVSLAAIRGQDGKLLPNVTISIGAAVLGPERSTAAALLSAADKALYDAKQNGRNRVVIG
jgi:diguanylate cyclase (GGDEF)-like protein